MARVWSCGFELQSNTSGIEADTFTGTTSIVTTGQRSGAAALRCNPTAGTGNVFIQAAAAETSGWCARAYFKFTSFPSSGSTTIIEYSDTSNGETAAIALLSSGALQLWDRVTPVGSNSATLVTGQWYRVELNIKAFGTGVAARLDGVEFASDPTMEFGEDGFGFRFGCGTTTTADLLVDDIAINDSTGTAQTSFPGEGRIVHLRPDSAGDNHGWLEASGVDDALNYAAVDEVTPDDATTYVKRTSATPTDDHNLQSSSSAGIGAPDTITLVQVGQRAGAISATATGRSDVLRIKGQASGTVLESASVDISVNGWITHSDPLARVYKLTAYTNPQDSSAWTPATLDTAQIGYRANVSSTNEIRVSTVWALVEYVAAAVTPQLVWKTRLGPNYRR